MEHATLLSKLVDQAISSSDFPESARVKSAICFLDFLSCALESAHLPWSQQVRDIAAKSSGMAPVVGEAIRASAEEAAFANAVRGHGLVREDMHTGSISHMGVVIWPVLISLAAENPTLAVSPLAAAISGYELGGRIGRELITPEMARHFRPTGLIGPLAATLAGAALLRFDREKTINALAFAANAFGGLMNGRTAALTTCISIRGLRRATPSPRSGWPGWERQAPLPSLTVRPGCSLPSASPRV